MYGEGTGTPLQYSCLENPYDYTVEVRNRFKGLDLIDGVPDELWTEVCVYTVCSIALQIQNPKGSTLIMII